jgi:hypothetical protein
VAGELLAVLVIVTLPDAEAPDTGAKVTLKVTCCPAASVYGKAGPLMLNPTPFTVVFVMLMLPVPEFVTVRV